MNPFNLYTNEIIQLQSLGITEQWLKMLDEKARQLLKDKYQEFIKRDYFRVALRRAISHGIEGEELQALLNEVVELYSRVKS